MPVTDAPRGAILGGWMHGAFQQSDGDGLDGAALQDGLAREFGFDFQDGIARAERDRIELLPGWDDPVDLDRFLAADLSADVRAAMLRGPNHISVVAYWVLKV
jgi:hypothetical protein